MKRHASQQRRTIVSHAPAIRRLAALTAAAFILPACLIGQMSEGRRIPGFQQTFRLATNEAALPVRVVFLGANCPGNILWPGEQPAITLQVWNTSDQQWSSHGRIEAIAYGTKGRPGDIWVPDMFSMGTAASVPIVLSLPPKGWTNIVLQIALPERMGAYGLVADFGRDGRHFIASLVRTFKPSRPLPVWPQFCTDVTDIEVLKRLGVAPNRIGIGYKPTTDPDFEKWYEQQGRTLMAYKAAGLPITLEIGGGSFFHPNQPLGRPRPWLDKDDTMMDTKFDLAWLPSYDEDFRIFIKRFVSDFGWPKGPINGIKLWNEPWNGISISGWGADDLRYREMFRVLCEATDEARREAGVQVLIGGCDSSSNTFDKLFGDGSDEFLKWLDFCSIHYQGMFPPSTVKAWVNRKHPNGRVRIWDTESWVANCDDRVATVIAVNLSTGHDRAVGVYHGNICGHETIRFIGDDGREKQAQVIQCWSVASAVGAANHFIGERRFRQLLFTNGLPWVIVFDGAPDSMGRPTPEDETIVVVGDIGEAFGSDCVMFRNARSLAERRHEDSLRRDLAALPPNAEQQRRAIMDAIDHDEPFAEATFTVRANGRFSLYDFYGNPVEPRRGRFTIPLDHRGFFFRPNGRKGDFDALVSAIRSGRIEGIEPLAKVCLDFLQPIGSRPSLRLRLTNVLNRPVRGRLKVSVGSLILDPAEQDVSFEAHQTREIIIKTTAGDPKPDNTYPLKLSFDAGRDGRSDHEELLHVNLISKRSINVDGNLSDWEGTLPQPVGLEGPQKATLQQMAWLPFADFPPAMTSGFATAFLAYDENAFYFAARVADTTPDEGMPRFETRDEDEYFYPPKCYVRRIANPHVAPFTSEDTDKPRELTWPEGVRRYSYRKEPELPAGNSPNHDNIQLAFNVLPPDKKDWYPCPPGTMPGYTGYRDTDYEYALNPVAQRYGGGTEVWRLQYPGMPHKHFYPHSPKSPLDGPVKDAKLVIRRESQHRIVECSIPWSEIPEVRKALDEGRTIKFSYRVNDNAGIGCLELSRRRSVARRNGSFTVDWTEHWANELEFAFER